MSFLVNSFLNVAGAFPTLPLWSYHEAPSYAQADNTAIATNWADLSGNGRVLTLTGSGITYQTAELNGLAVLRLDGTANAYFGAGDMTALNASGGSYMEIIKVTDQTTRGGHRLGTGASSHYPYDVDLKIYETFGSTARKDAITTGSALTSWHKKYVWSETNDYGIRQNASNIYTTATNTVGFHATSLVGFNGTQRMKCDLAAIYFFSNKLTPAELTSLDAYILAKWGL
jgi:hypothetical protein